MSDRLDELRRQRSLVQQQLEWIDAEIAAETARHSFTNSSTGAPSRPKPTSPIESISLTSAPASGDAEAIIKHYAVQAESAEQQTRRGCWTVFTLSLVALVVVVGVWYFLRTR